MSLVSYPGSNPGVSCWERLGQGPHCSFVFEVTDFRFVQISVVFVLLFRT